MVLKDKKSIIKQKIHIMELFSRFLLLPLHSKSLSFVSFPTMKAKIGDCFLMQGSTIEEPMTLYLVKEILGEKIIAFIAVR